MSHFNITVTTASPDCQQLISRGVLCTYGFQRDEAIRCFQKALTFDHNCAMAHYFIARNQAADYNNPDGLDYRVGYTEEQKALEMLQHLPVSDWEKALIEAQVHCFPSAHTKPSLELHKGYANAMRLVYQRFGGENMDVAALFAESLMMLAPWQLWTARPNIKPAIPETEEVVGVLEKALERDPSHPGLCHFYIHVMELSDHPERALPAANMLRTQYPEQGHLLHMPSHIDMCVGQYKEAIEVNEIAIIADEDYKARRTGMDYEQYDMYRIHNYHFIVWASMFDGQYATALKYAEAVEQQLDTEAVTCKLGDFPLGSYFLEAFATVPWHVLIRFGKWQQIIDCPVKPNRDLYPATIATAHYARAIAFAVTGKLEEADKERKMFYSTLQTKALEGRRLFSNIMHDPENHSGILDVAEAVMNGEVEYYKENYDEAFKHLWLAVQRDDNLIFDEPWGWMMPARHVLGALLLERGEFVKAEKVYREDLEKFKNNMWSLLGLLQCLEKQQKGGEIESVHAAFEVARARADVEINASCLCAKKL